jgi:O-acetylhomoserine (thiol)-lyase
MTNQDTYQLDTLSLHGGTAPDPTTGARAVPIYQSTSFVFQDTTHAERLFSLEETGNIYSRIGNPTVDAFEKRVALLEGGVAAVATSSGMAAITLTVLNLCESGDEIVAAINLYGGTYNLFKTTLKRYGITVRFVEPNDLAGFEAAINEHTKAIFGEIIGNPSLDVFDVEGVSEVAHRHQIPLIIDNTFATPYLIKPIEKGADLVIHSATKWIGGHGTTVGGVVVDGGRFNWQQDKFTGFTEPDPSYNNIRYANEFGGLAFSVKLRVQLLRDFGACLSPDSAFRLLQGLETLHLRVERHNQNALKLATYLDKHPAIDWVNYPGLASHPSHASARQRLNNGFGSIITFGIKGGREEGKAVIEAVSLWSHVANVGDAKSLIIHPASTTHQQLSPEELKQSGVTDDLIRLSVGLEHIDDLIHDLDRALTIATGIELDGPRSIKINDEAVIQWSLSSSHKTEDGEVKPKTIAVVGLSGKKERPSYRLAAKMQRLGYKIIPVNPRETEILGEVSYPDLQSVEDAIDIVQVFRAPEAAVGIAKEAIQVKPKVFWLQEGVVNDEACQLAKQAGLDVVHNRCTFKEAQRLRGSVVTYQCEI